jgi:hypothetical protein
MVKSQRERSSAPSLFYTLCKELSYTMSCCGKTDYNANGDLKDWKIFRDRTLALAEQKNDRDFVRYVGGVTDAAWAHILEANFFTPEKAMERLWQFYNTDVVPYRKKQ